MLQTWVNVYVQDFHFWIAWVQNQGQTRIIIPEFLTANSLLIHNIAFNTAWSLNIFLFTICFAKFSSMHMSNVFAQRSKRHFSWSHSKKGLYDKSWYHFFLKWDCCWPAATVTELETQAQYGATVVSKQRLFLRRLGCRKGSLRRHQSSPWSSSEAKSKVF